MTFQEIKKELISRTQALKWQSKKDKVEEFAANLNELKKYIDNVIQILDKIIVEKCIHLSEDEKEDLVMYLRPTIIKLAQNYL